MFKKDNIWLGSVLGLLLPAGMALLFFFIKNYIVFTDTDNVLFLMYQNKNLFYILSCFINLLLLRYYTKIEAEKTARGVVGITMLCAIGFFIYKMWVQDSL